MITSGMRTGYYNWFFFLLMNICGATLCGQNCTLECNPLSSDCGGVLVGFNAIGGSNVFCEGEVIIMENTSFTQDFDFFVMDWADGTLDTMYTYEDFRHTYSLPDSLLCISEEIGFSVCFIGVKECGNGRSCHEGSYSFLLKVRPLAQIDPINQVCINTPFTLTHSSCNTDSLVWDFGDGNFSSESSPEHFYSSTGTFTVQLTVFNECGTDSETRNINVVDIPVVDFDINPTDTAILRI